MDSRSFAIAPAILLWKGRKELAKKSRENSFHGDAEVNSISSWPSSYHLLTIISRKAHLSNPQHPIDRRERVGQIATILPITLIA